MDLGRASSESADSPLKTAQNKDERFAAPHPAIEGVVPVRPGPADASRISRDPRTRESRLKEREAGKQYQHSGR
jgi:hypothetical protein